MDKFLNQTQLKELVSLTSERLEIKYPSIIEKDYYITHVINHISNIENDYFRLIFAGGTCLAKAHKIVKRMSEDVDFKIQLKNTGATFSKSRMLKELKLFRSQIILSLELLNLKIGNSRVRNEGQYSYVELIYPSLFSANNILRPHILLEFTLSDVRLSTEVLTINTIIEETLQISKIFSPSSINCISVGETAIEKWVGLTRRVAAIERDYHADDSTLIRHVYDLNAIKRVNKITSDFFNLAKIIIDYDIKQFKNQHPEYFNSPSTEIIKSLEILRNKQLWKERYHMFIDSMVYEKNDVPNYDSALESLESTSKSIVEYIRHI